MSEKTNGTNRTAGNTCWFNPSIILVGEVLTGDESNQLCDSIFERLGLENSHFLINWELLEKFPDGDLGAQIDKKIALKYWEDLRARGYIAPLSESGEERPREVQIIFIVGANDKESCNHLQAQLAKFIQNIEKKSSKKILIHPMIIFIGDDKNLPSVNAKFWPRFKVGKRDCLGGSVNPIRIIEVVQNVLLTLISSDINCYLANRQFGNQSGDWISMGASAVRAELNAMRKYTRNQILSELVKPITKKLSITQNEAIKDFAFASAQKVINSLFETAFRLYPEAWEVVREKRNVTEITLNKGSSLKKILGEKNLSEMEKEFFLYFSDLDKKNKDNLLPISCDEFKRLASGIGLLLDQAAAKKNGLSYTEQLDVSVPHGLRAALLASRTISSNLKKSIDCYFKGQAVKPHLLSDDEFFHSLAKYLTKQVEASRKTESRFRRRIASILGLLIWLIPAFPLLTLLVMSFLPMGELTAALISGGVLLALGIIEFLYHQREIWKLKKKENARIVGLLADIQMKITAKNLRNYRHVLARKIDGIVMALTLFVADLEKILQESGEQLAWVKEYIQHKNDINPLTESIYEIADYEKCEEWWREAIKNANPEYLNSFSSQIISRELKSILYQPERACGIYTIFVREADKLTIFKPELLEPYAIALNYEDLKDGKIWNWLHTRAIPLGESGSKQFELMVLQEKAALSTRRGQNNPFWPKAADVVSTKLGHEIICVRGISTKENL